MKEKKFQPVALAMDREEAARNAGIRQALMNPPKDYAETSFARSYGVHVPNPAFVKMAQQADRAKRPDPVGLGPSAPTGYPTGPMPDLPVPDTATTGQPIPSPEPSPMQMAMPQMRPMQQPGLGMMQDPNMQDPMAQKRGLGMLMQRLQGMG